LLIDDIFDIAEELVQLDPLSTYPERGSLIVARLANARGFRLELSAGDVIDGGAEAGDPCSIAIPLRHGDVVHGTLHLSFERDIDTLELGVARWAARVLSRGLTYSQRLLLGTALANPARIEEVFGETRLTPRERGVVLLLARGCSTREIGERLQLTVPSVNTYLKRIFSKLGVHSRVELLARLSGMTTTADDGEVEPNTP
jgi:DNA-binding CsgD family transcriptional regulator